MAGYIEDRWLKKRPDKTTGKRERTSIWGKGKRYRVKGIPGIQDRSFDTSEDAKRWLAEAQTDSSRGDFVDPRNGAILLADYITDHWWPSRTDEPSTAGPMRSRIWNHLIPLLGSYSLREIDASALRRFKADLLSRVEESSAEIIWIHLTTILNAAVDDKRLLKSPIAAHRSIKRPKPVGKKAKARRSASRKKTSTSGRRWSTYGASSAGTGKGGRTSASPRAERPVIFPFRRTSPVAFGSTSSSSRRSSAPCRGGTLRSRRPSWKSANASRSPCGLC